uniref:Uncharacterized protein n=1 Tax=Magallana gigas TaxID=29159 RepID=A0A8W8NY23_MAGGI
MPKRGTEINKCHYKFLENGATVPVKYTQLVEGHQLYVPVTWLSDIQGALKGKTKSCAFKLMINGFFEPHEMVGKTGCKMADTPLGKALKASFTAMFAASLRQVFAASPFFRPSFICVDIMEADTLTVSENVVASSVSNAESFPPCPLAGKVLCLWTCLFDSLDCHKRTVGMVLTDLFRELLHEKDEEIAALLETTVEEKGKQCDRDGELETFIEIARQTGS